MSSLSFKISKAANLFEIIICYWFLSCSSFGFLRFNHSTSKSALLFTYCQSFPNFCNHQIMIISLSSPERSYIKYTQKPSPVYQYVISGCESSRQERSKCYLWMFWYRNIVLLTTRIFDVSEFTILKPLSLLPWCRLSFPIVGFKILSLPNVH